MSTESIAESRGAMTRSTGKLSGWEASISVRLLSATLATLLFWTPMAPIALADDGDEVPIMTQSGTGTAPIPQLSEAALAQVDDEELQTAPTDTEVDQVVDPEVARTEEAGEGDERPLGLPGVEARTAVTPQAIQLPSAEGSVQGMGESFAPILSSGTATFSVPIVVAPGRAGVQPSLSLLYSSTNGNGPVGFGWDIAVPFISRQTDRGLPNYIDRTAWHPEEDRFVYNGGQELVPVDAEDSAELDALATAGTGSALEVGDILDALGELRDWQQYRARVESSFMRFFRSPDSTRWVVQSRDGTRFDFGLLPTGEGPAEMAAGSRLSLESDPESPAGSPRVFRWGLTRMSDAHGSTVYYRHRADGGRSYLEDVVYVSPNACANEDPQAARRCAAPLIQYGARVHFEHEARQDIFSSYISGWRIETGLRLASIEVSAWSDAAGGRARVRRYHFHYDPSSFHSLLAELQVEGRPETAGVAGAPRGLDDVSEGSSAPGRTLPPMRFSYSTMPGTGDVVEGFGGLDTTVHPIVDGPPRSVDESRADLYDVNSDGLPDLVVTDPARYRTRDGAPAVGVFFNGFDGPGAVPAGRAAHFSEAVPMPMDAALSGVMTLSNLNVVPMDIDGDGRSDLLHMPRTREYGFFTPTRAADPAGGPASVSPAEQGWRWTHVPVVLPTGDVDPRIDLGRDGSHISTVDVNNDHLIDVVRTTGTVMQTWLNLGWLPDGDGRFGSYEHDGEGSYVLSTAPYESCLLQSGAAIDFENPEVRFAEMNGDGLLDIVEMRRDFVRYWPGRGLGAWGDGPRDCERGEGAGRFIDMGSPPEELFDLENVHLTDVNADGTADVVRIGFDSIEVWFNRAGQSFTRRTVARGTPHTPSFMAAIRLADIDGSGTGDIVWGTAHDWKYVDLAGGQRPRLLTRVENGLGAETTIEYGSSTEDYMDDLLDAHRGAGEDRFTWGRADGGHSLRLEALTRNGATPGVRVWRAAGTPVISTIVRRVAITDHLDSVGREPQVTSTSFAYHDGYYEGIEQEFRGFGAADSVTEGDWNHPTSYTRTFFQQGRRPQDIADDRRAYNPFEALKGREYLTEVFDENGVYLSSAHATLAVRELLVGLDDRPVQYAFVREANELRYDTTSWAPSAATVALDDVVRQVFDPEDVGWTSETVLTDRAMRIRGAGYARIRTTYEDVDSLGQVRTQTAHGSVGGVWNDAPITGHTVPRLIDPANWLWRTEQTFTDTVAPGLSALRATITQYTSTGDVARTYTLIEAVTDHEFVGEAPSEGGALALAQVPGVFGDIHLSGSTRYDRWGNSIASCVGADISTSTADVSVLPGGCLRYARVAYDVAFAQRAATETAHVATSGVQTLALTGTWDRGLGAVTSATDPNGLVTTIQYDGLGRLVGVTPPDIAGCSQVSPTTRIDYELAAPISRVVTTTYLECGAMGDTLVSYSYVDGLGRVRATLATGDSSTEWLRGGLSTLDSKGTVRRAYQPDVYAGDPASSASVLTLPRTASSGPGFPVFGQDDIPYTVTRYDAFGRAIGQHAEDGSYTSTSYHALSTDVCDALDNDPSSAFYRTCSTARTDGHGRVVDQILRTFDPDIGAAEQHRLWSYYREDGVVTDLVRAKSTGDRPSSSLVQEPDYDEVALGSSYPYVHRRFYFDTIGRRVATDDPDSNTRASGATLANRSWRYLFNIAGDLVAVRDPRGCGQNFLYDLGGRLLGEQYVSCSESVSSRAELPVASAPAGSIAMERTSSSLEVDTRYHYDAAPSWATPPSTPGGMLGRATGVTDRAQRSALAYDKRGNAIWAQRELAMLPDAPALDCTSRGGGDDRPLCVEDAIGADRDVTWADQTYTRTARFDHASRGTAVLLPTDLTWSSGAPEIGGTLRFNRRGLPDRAQLTVGCDPVTDASLCAMDAGTRAVFSEIAYARDGAVLSTTYGDDLGGTREPTQSFTTYDVRRRPVRFLTTREETGSEPRSLEAVDTVVDQQLVWDAASNLVETVDHRDPTEWPVGHRPQSTYVMHDALYRVIGAAFSYTQDSGLRTTADDATDWRDTQAVIRGANADPMDAVPAAMLQDPAHIPDRIQDLEWRWDWLGNQTRWDDDAQAFYERSVGGIQNGADVESEDLRPSALYVASNLPTSGSLTTAQEQRAGWTEVEYGDGGNVVSMTVHGRCEDAPSESCTDDPELGPGARAAWLREHCACGAEQHYEYRWDELDRIAEARRWDRVAPDTTWEIKVRQRYRYDNANARAVKSTFHPTGETDTGTPGVYGERIALYPYPGDLEVRGLERSGTASEYVAPELGGGDDHVEVQYVVAGARLVWRDVSGPEEDEAQNRRLMIGLADLIQTTAATIDLLTGDLTEVSTYYPNGARETLIANEDDPSALEPMGFTGKEADEEVGVIYFGERYLIPRLGRWASPDPLYVHAAGGGEALNSYHYVTGNLLQARDPLGLDVFVGVRGGVDGGGSSDSSGGSSGSSGSTDPGTSSEDAGGAPASSPAAHVCETARQAAYDAGEEFDGRVYSPGVRGTSVVNAAVEFIEAHRSEGERVILYGYSHGGGVVMDIAEELNRRGIEVDLVITVDAAYGPLSDSPVAVDRTVPENVDVNINYYQRTPSGIGSRGGANTPDDRYSRVYNQDLTGQSSPVDGTRIEHGNIDEATEERAGDHVADLIRSGVNGSDWEPTFQPGEDPERGRVPAPAPAPAPPPPAPVPFPM